MKKILFSTIRILIAILSLLFIVFGILGFRDHLWHLLVFGVIILFLTIFWNVFKSSSNQAVVSPRWKKIRNSATGILIVIAVFDVGLMISGLAAAQSDLSSKEEFTVVVLGTDVDGDQPGNLLKPRLDTAVTYLKEHPEATVIVSGKGRGEYTEAEVMYRYLAKAGIEEERILEENRAQSTPENLIFSNEIIEQKNLPPKMLIVTNNYHQLRASIYAKRLEITTKSLSGGTPWYLLFPLSERERFLIVTEWLGLSPDLVTKYQEI